MRLSLCRRFLFKRWINSGFSNTFRWYYDLLRSSSYKFSKCLMSWLQISCSLSCLSGCATLIGLSLGSSKPISRSLMVVTSLVLMVCARRLILANGCDFYLWVLRTLSGRESSASQLAQRTYSPGQTRQTKQGPRKLLVLHSWQVLLRSIACSFSRSILYLCCSSRVMQSAIK